MHQFSVFLSNKIFAFLKFTYKLYIPSPFDFQPIANIFDVHFEAVRFDELLA